MNSQNFWWIVNQVINITCQINLILSASFYFCSLILYIAPFTFYNVFIYRSFFIYDAIIKKHKLSIKVIIFSKDTYNKMICNSVGLLSTPKRIRKINLEYRCRHKMLYKNPRTTFCYKYMSSILKMRLIAQYKSFKTYQLILCPKKKQRRANMLVD